MIANFQEQHIRTNSLRRQSRILLAAGRMALALGFCVAFASVHAQVTPAPSSSAVAPDTLPDAPNPPNTGTISGTVADQDGAVIANATVVLTAGSLNTQLASGTDGSFTFRDVPAGTFQLSFSSRGFATETKSGVLHAGEEQVIPQVQLVVATTVEVNVTQTREEIAADQVHVEEEQRLFGVVPNYYVSYVPDAAPLNSKQKLHLGWKFVIDPVSFGITGVIAGVEQANNSFSGYGQGAQGYAKRFGAAYADFVSGTFFGNVIFPSVLKQDPRYFYKGTGTKKSRFFYALANAVICKGDNGHWQPNYSNVLGSLAAGGLSNLYYPASDRHGVGLTFTNAAIGLAGSAGSAVVQEFLFRKITSHSQDQKP